MKAVIAFGVAIAVLVGTTTAMSQEAKTRPGAEKRAGASAKGTMAQMDEQMKKMQALHQRMIAPMSADERQRAIEEARTEMQAAMAMMQPAPRGGGGDADAVPAEVMDSGFQGKRGQGRGQAQIMGKRMDLMQMTIQLVIDQQALLSMPKESATTKKKSKQ